jgi:MFS family permease
MAGLIASFTMGSLSDRLGRARVIMMLSGISTLCSFVFGWTIGWPFILVMGIGLAYAFSSLGDSPVLSAALTEVVTPSYLGAAFGVRSLFGFGAGAVSPLIFGVVLDWANPFGSGQEYYLIWGWAFITLGVGGLGAVWAAYRLRRLQG